MRLKILHIVTLFIFASKSFNGQAVRVPWVSEQPFPINYFIANHGQYTSSTTNVIVYGVEQDYDKIFFHRKGWDWYPAKPSSKREVADTIQTVIAKAKKNSSNPHLVYPPLSLRWKNMHPSMRVLSSDKSSHYYTFGESKYNSYGYKTILYKNAYNQIDIEYSIPKEGGIRYRILLHPGANIKDICFAYTGKDVQVEVESTQLQIHLPKGDFIEKDLHILQANGNEVEGTYTKNKNGIGFNIRGYTVIKEELIIDPWITSITTLQGNQGQNKGYDIEYDYSGNLYVYGGGGFDSTTVLTKVAKYSNAGNLLWTFNGSMVTPAWLSVANSHYAGNFLVEKLSGKVYIGQGFNSYGAVIIRLDSSGVYDNFISTQSSTFKEVWEMNFDCTNGNVLGMGGGTNSNINMGVIDSNGTYSTSNITSYASFCQDIVSSTIDPSGKLFVAMATTCGAALFNNAIISVNSTLNGNNWIKHTGFTDLQEANNKSFVGSSYSNGINCLHANMDYLYYYDGKHVKAFDKITGNDVGIPLSISGYTAKMQAGIYVDNCNDLFLGGRNGDILVYHFDGTQFIPKPSISIAGQNNRAVYDIKYNQNNNLLYVCGNQFVGTLPKNNTCADTSVLLVDFAMHCDTITAQILNPIAGASYSFVWIDSSSGLTAQSMINTTQVADTFTNAIVGNVYHLQVIKDALCGGASLLFRFVGSDYMTLLQYDTICPMQSITVNGHVYSTPGIYYDTLFAAFGCHTIIETHLTLIQGIDMYQQVHVCNGESYLFNGHSYSIAGTYIDTIFGFGNCDTFFHTQIIPLAPILTSLPVTTCTGTPYVFQGMNYYAAGIYYDTLQSYQGCDSVIEITLSVLDTNSTSLYLDFCDGQSVSMNGHTFSTQGQFFDTLMNSSGCDSLIIYQVTKKFHSTNTQYVSICNGSSYTIGGNSYSANGIYIDTLVNIAGCDSIVTTHLQLLDTFVFSYTPQVCYGGSFTMNGLSYNASGIYYDSILNTAGCDSVFILYLSIDTPSHSYHVIQVCEGESYSVLGNTYTSSGTYADSTFNADGCDSVVYTTLQINPRIQVVQNIDLCAGHSLTINGHTYTSSGVYVDTLIGSNTCDTILKTVLTVHANTNFSQEVNLCEGETFIINGNSYSKDGWYTDVLKNVVGCDSIISTNIKITKTLITELQRTICNGQFFAIQHANYHQAGFYIDTLQNAQGCDSIIHLSLSVDKLQDGGGFIPNVFSPNGDNINDCFGIRHWKEVLELDFAIYNRWGEQVFQTKNTWDCWDGKYKGELASQDTYYYFLKVKTKCGNQIFKGDVLLLR